MCLAAIATLAVASHVNSITIGGIIANNGNSDLFISSNQGIEFTDYENPKSVVSYYSVIYDVNASTMLGTVNCESGFKHEGLYGDGGRAYGISQFHRPTFEQFCPDLNYDKMQDQLQCMARMFSDDQQSHWTCFTNLYGG